MMPPEQEIDVRRDAEEHRLSLVAAAKTVFLKDGYGAPLASVLVEAGLGRGTLYRHFRGRVDLIIAIFENDLEASIEFVEANKEAKDFTERLFTFKGKVQAPHLLALGSLSDEDRKEMALALGPLMVRLRSHDNDTLALIRETQPLRADFDADALQVVFAMLAGAAIRYPHLPTPPGAARAVDLLLNGLISNN